MIGFGNVIAGWVGVGFFHVNGQVNTTPFPYHHALTHLPGLLARSLRNPSRFSLDSLHPDFPPPGISPMALHE